MNNLDIKTSLMQGWIDILLTKTTPKPADKPADKTFCKLNVQGTLNLMKNVGDFLLQTVNLGGNDGAQLASESTIKNL